MNSQARRILRKYGYDKRPWTFEIVEACCFEIGVEIAYAPMKRKGYYWVCEGVPTITLSDSLAGIEKLYVSTHELGHHFEHSPESGLYMPGSKSKREFEAKRFAVCALIPEPLMKKFLRQYSLWDLQEAYGFTTQLLEFRQQVYHQCGQWWKH